MWWLILLAVLVVLVLIYVWWARRLRSRFRKALGIEYPYFLVPASGIWRLWPDGRSMTLKLPFVGVFLAIHPKDYNAPEWKFQVTLQHEETHAGEVDEEGYGWYLSYLLSKRSRFQKELRAFRVSILTCEAWGIMSRRVPTRGTPVSNVFYYAYHLSRDYRLGKDFDFQYCYEYLLRQTRGGL